MYKKMSNKNGYIIKREEEMDTQRKRGIYNKEKERKQERQSK